MFVTAASRSQERGITSASEGHYGHNQAHSGTVYGLKGRADHLKTRALTPGSMLEFREAVISKVRGAFGAPKFGKKSSVSVS